MCPCSEGPGPHIRNLNAKRKNDRVQNPAWLDIIAVFKMSNSKNNLEV